MTKCKQAAGILALLGAACLVGGLLPSVRAQAATAYIVDSHPFTYGEYRESDHLNLWFGAPGDSSAFVSGDTYVNPGSTYATAICFTAPCDLTVSTIHGNGYAYRWGDAAPNTDGIRFSVFWNNTKVFPEEGLWDERPQGNTDGNGAVTLPDNISMKKGDELLYIVDSGGAGNSDFDVTYLVLGFRWVDEAHPEGTWFDSHAAYYTTPESGEEGYGEASDALHHYKRNELIDYRYVSIRELDERDPVPTEERSVRIQSDDFVPTNLNGEDLWAGAPGENNKYCYVNGVYVAPSASYAAAVKFTAPCDGTISNALGGGTVYRSGEAPAGTDGTRVSVIFNDIVQYPYEGVWADIPQGSSSPLGLNYNSLDVKAGDELWYVIDCGGAGNSDWDVNVLRVSFLWIDEAHSGGVIVDFTQNYYKSAEEGEQSVTFGEYKRGDVFTYHYVNIDECTPVGEAQELSARTIEEYELEELNYSSASTHYYKLEDPNLIAFPDYCGPGDNYMLGIGWKAPSDGRVDLSGSAVTNFRFLTEPDAAGNRSDGVRIRILLNGTSLIFPTEAEWTILANANRFVIEMQPFAVKKGDEIMLVIDKYIACNYDTCRVELGIAFAEDGAAYTESYHNERDFLDSYRGGIWKYYAVREKAALPDGDGESELPTVLWKGKGCSGAVLGSGIGGVTLLAVAAGVTMCLKKRKGGRS